MDTQINQEKQYESLLLAHHKLCDWNEKRPSGGVRSSEPHGKNALIRLRKFAKVQFSLLPENIKDSFVISISKGKSSLPTILWIALVPKNYSVFKSLSVTTCFGFEGTGSVVGLMDAVICPQAWLPTVERKQTTDRFVNLNKKGGNYHYNDKFINPKEFHLDDFSSKEFIEHVVKSCEILTKEMLKRSSVD